MARKRASLKDKGEEILGVKRGGQGADILFGTSATPARRASADEQLTEGEADLDDTLSLETGASRGMGTLAAVTEAPVAEAAMPSGESDLDEELDLDSLLSAEAVAAQGEAPLPELATTPAAAAPPLPELATTPAAPAPPPPALVTPSPPPPAVERPAPTALPAMPTPPPPSGVLSPALERPAPAPPPPALAAPPSPPVTRPAPAPPPAPAAAAAPPFAAPRPPSPAAVPPPPSAEVLSPPAPTLAMAPPSTASGAPDLSAPRPPRYLQMVGGDFDLLAEEVSPDAAAAAQIGAPESVRLTAEQREELLQRRSIQDKLAEIGRAIDGQYERILRENISASEAITLWCHNMLAEARTAVLNRHVDRLAEAEWYVEQVRARLDRAVESRTQAKRYAWPITGWGVAWFIVLVYLLFNPMLILVWLNLSASGDQFLVPEIFLRSLYFGGIGGVAAIFYHLFKYVSRRSFDSQYGLSFVGKPFMGMILGSMVYLTIFVAMRILGFAPLGMQSGGSQTITDVMYMALLFFVSMAAGFKENLAFNLLNRMIKSVLGAEGGEETPAPPPTAAAGTP